MTSPSPPDSSSPGPRELVAATERPVMLSGGPAIVTISAPEDTRELLKAAGAPGPGRVVVSVDDIKADVTPAVVYGVYLNPAGDEVDRDRYRIGNLSFFGIELLDDPDRRHDHAPGFRQLYDATQVAGLLTEQGLWDPASVTVTFEPIPILPPPGAEDTWAGGRTKKSHHSVEIGRVGIFVA